MFVHLHTTKNQHTPSFINTPTTHDKLNK